MTGTWRAAAVVGLTLAAMSAARSGDVAASVASSAGTAAALGLALALSEATGRRLMWVLFALYAGVSTLTTLPEAVFFAVMPLRAALLAAVGGVATAFAAAVLMTALSGRLSAVAGSRRVFAGLGWRLPLLGAIYCVLYFAAGAAVFPFVRDFYATRHIPALGELLAMQMGRGMLYGLSALPWLGSVAAGRRTGLALGALFATLGGIAPLLGPNEYMPPGVRFAHGVEVGVSNFVFGWIAARLLAARARTVLPDSGDGAVVPPARRRARLQS